MSARAADESKHVTLLTPHILSVHARDYGLNVTCARRDLDVGCRRPLRVLSDDGGADSRVFAMSASAFANGPSCVSMARRLFAVRLSVRGSFNTRNASTRSP